MSLLIAMPILRGERLNFVDFEFFGTEQADEPPEQPRIVTCEIGFVPGLLLQGTITTASMQASYASTLGGKEGGSGWAPDPNPSAGEEDWLDPNPAAVLGGRKLWTWNGLTKPTGIAVTGWTETAGVFNATNVETKHSFYRSGKLRGGHFQDSGILMFVFNNPAVGAQTDFGVAEMDNQVDLRELFVALNDAEVAADSDEAKVQELLWGGDSYVEADTLKQFEGRVYCRAVAGFSGIERVVNRLKR